MAKTSPGFWPVVLSRAWGIAAISALGELLVPPRLTAVALRLAVQLFLVVCLWRGLYAHTGVTAGIDREQAVGYAVLATLAIRMRSIDRSTGRDTVLQHMNFGTIVYWFLRPLTPRHYYALRAVGDQLYGFVWALAGYLVCWAVGAVELPGSGRVLTVFLLSLLLGQWVLYHVMLMIDLMCFWTLRNNAALLILQFTQNLLSGVYAPLWFFPAWFVTVSSFLPFQYSLNVPLSIYIGRIPLGAAPRYLMYQVLWGAGLALCTRWLWHRSARRVISQGG
ncbi:ABC-2 family transporter protein [Streptomyces sp. ME02-8801-2C]|uniref:ABC transporter permease n=1 Tax=Streptomyces sp. ME02-8801-2C TaxID=3028680 RepID=UPI0029AAB719|nr:ABC-2 family transporter protein [Streptomyces sp. ME02-8801-2C]MDX3458206.1 ABC-2 family transporter protein [Streptomyces sp. ME02-8801-2C]